MAQHTEQAAEFGQGVSARALDVGESSPGKTQPFLNHRVVSLLGRHDRSLIGGDSPQ